MKKTNNILVSLCLVLFSVQAYSQHFYDSAGHVLAYQKGVILYNSLDKPIGRIWPGGFKDTAGNLIVTAVGNSYSFTHFYKYKFKDSMDYVGVYKDGMEIFSTSSKHLVGQLQVYSVYDASGTKLGYTDKEVPESEAIIFYFLLLPIFGG